MPCDAGLCAAMRGGVEAGFGGEVVKSQVCEGDSKGRFRDWVCLQRVSTE